MKKGRKRISEQERLIRHLEPLKNLCLDDIVNRLRSTYPSFYQRIKLPIFTTKVEKTLASLSVKQHSMAKQPRIRSIEQEEEEEEIGQGNFHKRRRLNYAASESEEDSGEEDSGEEDSGKEDPDLAVCSLEYAIPNIPNNKLSSSGFTPRVVQLNSGIGGDVRFSDLGGMEKAQNELERFVMLPFRHPELAISLGVKPVSGVLLHGPPGCGKTKLAHAIANELGIPFYKISATQLVSSVTGSSEENIRDLFSKAYRTAPSIVFIDEIDAIATKREDVQRAMEGRIVTQLMTSMDESHRPTVLPAAHDDPNSNSQSSDQKYPHVLVIGATNRPDVIDSALRRPGRFELGIFLGPPDESARLQILSLLTRNLTLQSGSFDLLKIARSTSGFVGADLTALVNRAGSIALERIVNNMVAADVSIHSASPKCNQDSGPQVLTMADFEDAVKAVQPSLKREGFAAIPNVKWEDVGGLDSLREDLYRSIVRRIKHPDIYKNFGLDLETGFLLYGPPGCGKTLIAKAVASEAGANFIYVKGAELLNKYVGESELAVRTLFSRARTCSPCIIFFDEVDALTTKRGRQGGWVIERLLNQLLAELDGGDQQQGVFVIGATNRPDAMDPAVLRPGRFGKHIYVSLPSRDERCLILKALARKKPIDPSVDLNEIGRWKALENFSGADLSAMMNEAAMAALEEGSTSTDVSVGSYTQTIKKCHLEQSVAKITPSVTNKQLKRYLKFGKAREQCFDHPFGRPPRPHLGWPGLKECSK